MVTCPTCGVVLFVDMDGVAQAAGEPDAASSADAPPSALEAAPTMPPMQLEPMAADSGDFGQVVIPGVAPADGSVESSFGVPFEIPGMRLEQDPVSTGQPHAQPAGETPQPTADPEQDSSEQDSPGQDLDMGGFLGYDSAPSESSNAGSSQNDPNDPLGISAYADSELSSAKNGPLVVTVIISGIDTKDLRSEIRQAIQDSRFGWDAGAVMASIKGGTLVLSQISPVKASIVINRIKNLAVQIRWEQNAITELEISPSDSPP